MDKALLQRTLDALTTAVKQNQHDMLMTGSECRAGEAAIADLQAAIAQPEQPALQPLADAPVMTGALSNTKRKKLLSQMRQCGGRPTKKHSEDGARLIVSAEDLERFISVQSNANNIKGVNHE